METTWMIAAVLGLAAAVFAVLMVRAQGANGFIRSELESARKERDEARTALEAREQELAAARGEIDRLKSHSAAHGGAVANDEAGTEPAAEAPGSPQTIIRRVEPPAPEPESPTAVEDEAGAAPRTMLFKPPADEEPEDSSAGMPYLRISGGGEDDVHFLGFDSNWVGREAGNDIVIGDAAASRRHFEIVYTNNRFKLRDNESTNGTKCNGASVDEAWLEFGDKVTVGETDMVFSCEGFELRDSDAAGAIQSLEKCVRRQPEFVSALKILAFMLERDVGRKSEAAPLWEAIARLEK